jgi:fructuronate reductase
LLVADVAPYETAKLRLLNGAHSTCAYLGYLAGHEFVHEVMADATFAPFVEGLMREEISPVTPAPAGMEHERYIPDLLERFRNPSLRHRTQQIAMDGSQKLPQRLLATIRLQLERGGPIDGLSLAVAAWMRYVLGTDESGKHIEVSDPLASCFAAIADECEHSPTALVDRFLELETVFGDVLPGDSRFRGALLTALESLLQRGSRASAERWLATKGVQ